MFRVGDRNEFFTIQETYMKEGFTKKEEGSYHDIQSQSEGYSDMIGTCIRFALLDVMYQNERPVVVMDDPFVNLDEEHLKSAKEFLKQVSADYQIIYCTCHKDRA